MRLQERRMNLYEDYCGFEHNYMHLVATSLLCRSLRAYPIFIRICGVALNSGWPQTAGP